MNWRDEFNYAPIPLWIALSAFAFFFFFLPTVCVIWPRQVAAMLAAPLAGIWLIGMAILGLLATWSKRELDTANGPDKEWDSRPAGLPSQSRIVWNRNAERNDR